MKRPKSERQASASRPARRSLTEFTSPAAANPAAIPLSPAGTPRARPADVAPPVENAGAPNGHGVAENPGRKRDIVGRRSAPSDDTNKNAIMEDDAMPRPIEKDDDLQDDASAAS